MIQYLDRARRVAAVRRYKGRSLALLEAGPGQRVLDVGCGTGEEVRILAQLVGPAGRAVGVDRSLTMVMEARRRPAGPGLPVAYCVGDAHRLPFARGAFDGCRAERVLMHLVDPGRALAEMARVVRPGGRVVAAEPDFTTLAVVGAAPALSGLLCAQLAASFRTGAIGRRLPELFARQGLTRITVEPGTLRLTDLRTADQLFHLRAAAEHAGRMGLAPPEVLSRWLADLDEASRAGRFSCTLTGFLVCGRTD
jgi:SAM-dependent methyltransferase